MIKEIVKCRSCGALQTLKLWRGNREKRRGFNKKNCCWACGKMRFKYYD